MRCKNCGATVASKLPVCKYCGTENEVYIRRKQDMEFVTNIFNKEKRKELIEASPDIVVRLLNKFIIITTIIMLIVVTISFIIHFKISDFDIGTDMEISAESKKEHLSVLEKMHKEKRFYEINGYIRQNSLYGEEYSLYMQAGEIYEDMNRFLSYTRYFENTRNRIENGENTHYNEEYASDYYSDIMCCANEFFNFTKQNIIYEIEIFPENKDYYQECLTEVTAYIKYRSGLNDEEIKNIFSFEKTYSDEFADYCRTLYSKFLSQGGIK
jgi:uncharacterized OB-fold protein